MNELHAILFTHFEITWEAGSECCNIASENSMKSSYTRLEQIAALPKTDFRIFGKPSSRLF
jgi:phosphoribosylglycinamide formyltransferase 2